MRKIRDYGNIEDALKNFGKKIGFTLKVIGRQKGSKKDIYMLSARKNQDNPLVLISTGTHGSEPAGVFAVQDFLKNGIGHWLDHFNFDILPCNNPHGFEIGTRRNPEGQDINHNFHAQGKADEAEALMQWFKRSRQKYLIFLDLHEDSILDLDKRYKRSDYPGKFYMYETCNVKKNRIGRVIVENMKKLGMPVSMKYSIYGDKNAGGVIWYPEGRTGKEYKKKITFDDFLMRRHTDHALVIETPAIWNINKRISIQRKIIDIVLGSKLKSKLP